MSQTIPAFSVVKTTVELYKIRHTSGCYWADITIDSHERAGRISIASDFGAWSNYWGACGEDFKSFLASLNEDYVAEKFGAEPRIDVQTSAKAWYKEIIEHRRKEHITEEEARDAWNEIEGLAMYGHRDIETELLESNNLIGFLREWADCSRFEYEPDPRFAQFWKQVWPVLLAEFAREAATAPALSPAS